MELFQHAYSPHLLCGMHALVLLNATGSPFMDGSIGHCSMNGFSNSKIDCMGQNHP
jgi:hypothetical protein